MHGSLLFGYLCWPRKYSTLYTKGMIHLTSQAARAAHVDRSRNPSGGTLGTWDWKVN